MNEHKRSTQTKQTKIMQIPTMTTYILLHGLKNIPVSYEHISSLIIQTQSILTAGLVLCSLTLHLIPHL